MLRRFMIAIATVAALGHFVWCNQHLCRAAWALAVAAVSWRRRPWEAGIAEAGAAVLGVGAAVGARIGDPITITTNRVTAAGCACGFCAIIIGWCGRLALLVTFNT